MGVHCCIESPDSSPHPQIVKFENRSNYLQILHAQHIRLAAIHIRSVTYDYYRDIIVAWQQSSLNT
jgi:hypothetical protein